MPSPPSEPIAARVAAVTRAGWRDDDPGLLSAARRDRDARVRAAALGALARRGLLDCPGLADGLADPDPRVRRRACELAATSDCAVDLVARLDDADPFVAEAAAFALGERPVDDRALAALIDRSESSAHPLVREAAVAALGSLQDERALPAILRALSDVVTIRRRAVLALAPFDGTEVVEALQRAAADRDWQVRNAADDLLRHVSD